MVACLDFPPPLFGELQLGSGVGFVVIKTSRPYHGYYFQGIACGDLGLSQECAARKAIHMLMAKYAIEVDDMSAEELKRHETDIRMTEVMRSWFVELEKGKAIACPKPWPIDAGNSNPKRVTLDYVDALDAVVKFLGIKATCVETVQLGVNKYISWLGLVSTGLLGGFKWIRGEVAASAEDAKQTMGKAALSWLQVRARVVIRDVNYDFIRDLELKAYLSRESYLTVKERLLGNVDTLIPADTIVEEELIVPNNVYYRSPPAWKRKFQKRKRGGGSMNCKVCRRSAKQGGGEAFSNYVGQFDG